MAIGECARGSICSTPIPTDSVVDSGGNFAPSADSDTLRLSFGPRVGTRMWAGDNLGVVAPYFEIEGQWDIVDGPDVLAPSGATLANDSFNFRLAGSVNMNVFQAGNLALEASVMGGGGGDDEGYDLKGSLNLPLN